MTADRESVKDRRRRLESEGQRQQFGKLAFLRLLRGIVKRRGPYAGYFLN